MSLFIISIICMCMFVNQFSSFLYFSSHDNCIVYALMYVYIFSYLVNKLEIRWLYLSLIEKIRILGSIS